MNEMICTLDKIEHFVFFFFATFGGIVLAAPALRGEHILEKRTKNAKPDHHILFSMRKACLCGAPLVKLQKTKVLLN